MVLVLLRYQGSGELVFDVVVPGGDASFPRASKVGIDQPLLPAEFLFLMLDESQQVLRLLDLPAVLPNESLVAHGYHLSEPLFEVKQVLVQLLLLELLVLEDHRKRGVVRELFEAEVLVPGVSQRRVFLLDDCLQVADLGVVFFHCYDLGRRRLVRFSWLGTLEGVEGVRDVVAVGPVAVSVRVFGAKGVVVGARAVSGESIVVGVRGVGCVGVDEVSPLVVGFLDFLEREDLFGLVELRRVALLQRGTKHRGALVFVISLLVSILGRALFDLLATGTLLHLEETGDVLVLVAVRVLEVDYSRLRTQRDARVNCSFQLLGCNLNDVASTLVALVESHSLGL